MHSSFRLYVCHVCIGWGLEGAYIHGLPINSNPSSVPIPAFANTKKTYDVVTTGTAYVLMILSRGKHSKI